MTPPDTVSRTTMVVLAILTICGIADQAFAEKKVENDRTYTFNLVDKPWEEILKEFTQKTGYSFTGHTPEGNTTLDFGRERVSLELARSRLGTTLFAEGYFPFKEDGNNLCIGRITESTIHPSPSSIFPTEEEFLTLPVSRYDSIVLLLTRFSGLASHNTEYLIKLIPSHVRASLLSEEETTNKPSTQEFVFFGAARDIRHYLSLVHMFNDTNGTKDMIAITIPLRKLEPDDAIEVIQSRYQATEIYSEVELATQQDSDASEDASKLKSPAIIRIWPDSAYQRIVITCPEETADAVKKLISRYDNREDVPIGVTGPKRPTLKKTDEVLQSAP